MNLTHTKLGDLRAWVVVIIALGGIAYNAITSRAIQKNELKHIGKNIQTIERRLERIEEYLWRVNKE